ncbi:hypothetical protein CPHO_06115 [Corynebacterium phocae]|uniref:Sec-independent protein translocase protein TatC n=2 Tax=Corynebacterium phocae TaxID=161895 RepID=A0A1L7D6D6_9CORY|nr:hypothetical protein CPHO_06115 [Corynebacterium phocae]KAA8725210.1 twin-arginine translocase subunit TatC [Corynebacterium phocae]
MTLIEHLQELRKRLFLAVLFLSLGTAVGFIWYGSAPAGWAPLGEILRQPYCDLPPEMRASFNADNECRLLATRPFEMFMLRLKVGALAGVVISSPLWLYQVWAFIVPGLHKNERRWTYAFVSVAVLLFTAGALLAYFVMSIGLRFLLGIGDEFQAAALSGGDYYNYFLALLVIFGISFEVPLVIVMLNVLGIVEYATVKGKRRLTVVIIMVFAAVLTPGGEPASMLIMSVCVWLLVELAFQFCRINDKRRNRSRPEWMDVDDESAAPVAPAQPVAPPAPAPAPRRVQPGYPPQPARPASPSPTPVAPQPVQSTRTQESSHPQRPGRPAPKANPFDDVL